MTKEEFKICAEDRIVDISHTVDELRQRAGAINNDIEEEYIKELDKLIILKEELKGFTTSFDCSEKDDLLKSEFSKKVDFLKKKIEYLFNLLSK